MHCGRHKKWKLPTYIIGRQEVEASSSHDCSWMVPRVWPYCLLILQAICNIRRNFRGEVQTSSTSRILIHKAPQSIRLQPRFVWFQYDVDWWSLSKWRHGWLGCAWMMAIRRCDMDVTYENSNNSDAMRWIYRYADAMMNDAMNDGG